MAATAPAQLTPAELRPADLLLWRHRDWPDALIRWLDRGRYSDVGFYDGHGVIVCGPCGVERRPPFAADVYRFHHADQPLGSSGLDAEPLLAGAPRRLTAAAAERGTSSYLLGLLLIMRRTGRSRWQRAAVESFGPLLLRRLRRSLQRHFPSGTVALTGSELVTLLFEHAAGRTGLPYHILSAPAARHRYGAWPPTSGRFEYLMQQVEELLTRVRPDLPIAISRARSTAPGARRLVAAGGPLAPAGLVTPGDLQHSPSFVLMGRLMTGPRPPAPARPTDAAAIRGAAPAGRAETPRSSR